MSDDIYAGTRDEYAEYAFVSSTDNAAIEFFGERWNDEGISRRHAESDGWRRESVTTIKDFVSLLTPTTTRIVIKGWENLINDVVHAIARACKSLTYIEIDEHALAFNSLMDASMLDLAKNCPLLETIDIKFCKRLTDKTLSAVADGCRRLESLRIIASPIKSSMVTSKGLEYICLSPTYGTTLTSLHFACFNLSNDAGALIAAPSSARAQLAGSGADDPTHAGDSVIDAGVNIGAGTITCNYDGAKKHQTRIGAGAFVGSNSTLVAPVEVGPGSYVAAGSVITKDIPADALGLGRERQVNKEGWASRRREKTDLK